MAVAFTELTAISNADTSNNTTFNTASLTPVANRLYVIFVSCSYTSGITLSSVSGGGLGTWTIEAGCSIENSGGNRRLEVAWAWSSSPGAAAAIAIQWSGATTGGGWSVWEVTGFNTSDPIGQTASTTGNALTSISPTLGSGTSGSGILAGARVNTEEAFTVEAGWTAGESNTHGSPSFGMRTAYRTDIGDLSCTFSWTASTTAQGSIIEILAAGGAKTVTVNQASGSNTAQAILKQKIKAVAQNTGTNTAQAIARQRRYAVAQVVETDTAQAIAFRSQQAVSHASETNAAQPITVQRRYPVGLVSETDAAQAIAFASQQAVVQANETDAAQQITARKIKTTGQVAETDAAQVITVAKRLTVTQVSESDTAQQITEAEAGVITETANQAAETDTAQAITARKIRVIGLTEETDLAQAISRTKQKSVSHLQETDAAQAIERIKIASIQQVSETDLAQALFRNKRVVIVQVSETDLAQSLAHQKILAVAQIAENDLALPFSNGATITESIHVYRTARNKLFSTHGKRTDKTERRRNDDL